MVGGASGSLQKADALVRFGSVVVDAGKRHRVWDMHRYAAGGDTFEQHVRGAIAEGDLPFLIRRAEDPEPAGEVAVYRNNEIADVVTSDDGLLLRELRPERNRTEIDPVAAIGLERSCVPAWHLEGSGPSTKHAAF